MTCFSGGTGWPVLRIVLPDLGAIRWNSFFTPGALIAAVVVVLLTEGPRGLLTLGPRLIRWRVSCVWYALAIGVPLFVHFASVSVNVALGASAPSLTC